MPEPTTANVVNMGRPGPWGNPWRVGFYSREQVVTFHEGWFLAVPQDWLREKARQELRGKTIDNGLLWCPGCKGTRPCHVEIIEKVANA